MAVNYPESLGGFLKEGYAYSINAGIKRTSIDGGQVVQVPDFNESVKINVSQKLTLSQLELFEVFFLRSAYDWFFAKIETGQGLRLEQCRALDGSVDVVKDGNLYAVSLVLELKNGVLPDSALLTQYPTVLGVFLKQDYSYSLNAGVGRVGFVDGSAIQRRTQIKKTILNVSQKLTLNQVGVFESFFVKSAYQWFSATIETGQGLRSEQCRAVDGTVQIEKVGNLYHISLSLELKITHTVASDDDMTAEYLNAMYGYGLVDITSAASVSPLSPLIGV